MQPLALSIILGPLGTTEILVIVLVLVLLFGARKIPELARGLGRGVTEFKQGIQGDGGRKHADTAKLSDQSRPADEPPESPAKEKPPGER